MAQKAKILVVDDERSVCVSIQSALTDKDCVVHTALNGGEALEKERKERYDVVITDLMMPEMNGMDLLKTLLDRRPDLKIIMITGFPSIKTAVEAVKLGAFDYLPKPFTPHELRSLAARAIQSKLFHEERTEKSKIGEKEKKCFKKDFHCIPENSWVRVEKNGMVSIGITHVFLKTIGEIISMDVLLKEKKPINQGEIFLKVTDSNDHVHHVWAPVGGSVVATNKEIERNPKKLVKDPYGEGWILIMKPHELKKDLRNLVFLECN